jgi:hypothetical protein
MSLLKLEYNNKVILLHKNNNAYTIKTTEEWVMLTNFTTAYLITEFPYGEITTSVNKKFIYNQNYELYSDLDFNYKYILPIGSANESNGIIQFTGNFNGNNHIIKNINIINTTNNGLFGIVSSSKITNLTIQNIIINDGLNNGGLISKATNVELENITIIGNIQIAGTNSAVFVSVFDGIAKNIKICIDGIIEGKSSYSIISNNFYGVCENICVISNLINPIPCFYILNGKLNNSCYMSFNTIKLPFYIISKYYQIFNCYYFQLNNEPLAKLQCIYNSFYKNLKEIIYITNKSDFDINNHWFELNNKLYLKNILNYTNDNIYENNHILFYDIISNKSNCDNYINLQNKYITKININKYNENYINEQKVKANEIYNKEIENNANNMKEIITLHKILKDKSDNKLVVDLDNEPVVDLDDEPVVDLDDKLVNDLDYEPDVNLDNRPDVYLDDEPVPVIDLYDDPDVDHDDDPDVDLDDKLVNDLDDEPVVDFDDKLFVEINNKLVNDLDNGTS